MWSIPTTFPVLPTSIEKHAVKYPDPDPMSFYKLI